VSSKIRLSRCRRIPSMSQMIWREERAAAISLDETRTRRRGSPICRRSRTRPGTHVSSIFETGAAVNPRLDDQADFVASGASMLIIEPRPFRDLGRDVNRCDARSPVEVLRIAAHCHHGRRRGWRRPEKPGPRGEVDLRAGARGSSGKRDRRLGRKIRGRCLPGRAHHCSMSPSRISSTARGRWSGFGKTVICDTPCGYASADVRHERRTTASGGRAKQRVGIRAGDRLVGRESTAWTAVAWVAGRHRAGAAPAAMTSTTCRSPPSERAPTAKATTTPLRCSSGAKRSNNWPSWNLELGRQPATLFRGRVRRDRRDCASPHDALELPPCHHNRHRTRWPALAGPA